MPVSVDVLKRIESVLRQIAVSEANFATMILARIMKAYPILGASDYNDYCHVHPYFVLELVCDYSLYQ
jgi:hypothetical protein